MLSDWGLWKCLGVHLRNPLPSSPVRSSLHSYEATCSGQMDSTQSVGGAWEGSSCRLLLAFLDPKTGLVSKGAGWHLQNRHEVRLLEAVALSLLSAGEVPGSALPLSIHSPVGYPVQSLPSSESHFLLHQIGCPILSLGVGGGRQG